MLVLQSDFIQYILFRNHGNYLCETEYWRDLFKTDDQVEDR